MFSKLASRFLLPQFERDLSSTLKTEIAKVNNMMDCMIAPTVHAFEPAYIRGFAPTAKQAQRVVKVDYQVPRQGLFHE